MASISYTHLKAFSWLRTSVFVLFSALFLAALPSDGQELKPGIWRGVIDYGRDEVPFNFEVVKTNQNAYEIYIMNGQERLRTGDVAVLGNRVIIPMHVFDSDIKAMIVDENTLQGIWTKYYLDNYKVDFRAEYGQDYRYKEKKGIQPIDFSGTWDMTFRSGSGVSRYVGDFQQTGSTITGTILTPKGDYRYLEGVAGQKEVRFSTFDGGHGFGFYGKIQDDGSVKGRARFSKYDTEEWTAVRNPDAMLEDPFEISPVEAGVHKMDFSFKAPDGRKIDPQDPQFAGKVLIIQVFGTWCPNSMDQSNFLTQWYEQNKEKSVEIVALSYEAGKDENYARRRIEEITKRMSISYPVVHAGSWSKEEAALPFPFIEELNAFPTLIFVDKQGYARAVHSYFTGPGTGKHYEEFKVKFEQIVTELLSE